MRIKSQNAFFTFSFLSVFIHFWLRRDQLCGASPPSSLGGPRDGRVTLSHVSNFKLFDLVFTDVTYTFEVWGIRKAWRFRTCAIITMKLDLLASYLSKEKPMKWGTSTGHSSPCGTLEWPPPPCVLLYLSPICTWAVSTMAASSSLYVTSSTSLGLGAGQQWPQNSLLMGRAMAMAPIRHLLIRNENLHQQHSCSTAVGLVPVKTHSELSSPARRGLLQTLGERLCNARLFWASWGYPPPPDTFRAFWNTHDQQAVANHFIPTLKSGFSLKVGEVSEHPNLFIVFLADGMFSYTEILGTPLPPCLQPWPLQGDSRQQRVPCCNPHAQLRGRLCHPTHPRGNERLLLHEGFVDPAVSSHRFVGHGGWHTSCFLPKHVGYSPFG